MNQYPEVPAELKLIDGQYYMAVNKTVADYLTSNRRELSERECFMIEAAMYHGFEMIGDEGNTYIVTDEQVVSLLQNYMPPDQQTLSQLKINDWISTEIAAATYPTDGGKGEDAVGVEAAGEIARGAALQVIFDKATLVDNLVNNIHTLNVRAGWWNDIRTGVDLHGKRNVGELLALVHSEISEAIEAEDDDIAPLMNAQIALLRAVALQMNRKQALLDINVSISRALEAFRKGGKLDDKLTHRPGFRVELLDAVIRIFDVLGSDREAQRNHPAGTIFVEKVAFNQERADHKPENRRLAGGKSI